MEVQFLLHAPDFNKMNTKMQGNIGVGQAIAYYTKNLHVVSLPLNDSQGYDLVVEKEGKLLKVQVKTTGYKTPYGDYSVNLKTCGGNQSFHTVKHFDNTETDLLFIYCLDGTMYEIPSIDMNCKASANLGRKWDSYKVIF